MTKISYLVSTYDSGNYLDAHIADLLNNQTDPDFEIVIVNPNSPGTDDIIAQKWAAQDERINYIFHPEREWYGESWLRAWKHASGEFVMNSNTDDFHAPQTTETVYKYMKMASNLWMDKPVAFGYGGLVVLDENHKPIGGGQKPAFDFELMSRECWAGPQVVWKNDKRFRESVDWDLMKKRANEYRSAFDYWMWLYFMSLGFAGYSIPDIITYYTQRADSIENSNKWANNWETYSAISEFFPENFDSHLSHASEFRNFEDRPEKEIWIQNQLDKPC